jgi:hypothetical protein
MWRQAGANPFDGVEKWERSKKKPARRERISLGGFGDFQKLLFLWKNFQPENKSVMAATVAERKLQIIELLAKLENEEMLAFIEQFLQGAAVSDWADELSESDLRSIQKGMEELDSGKGEDWEKFKTRMQSKYP